MDARALERRLGGTPLAPSLPALIAALEALPAIALRHGDLPGWRAAVAALPVGPEPCVRVDGGTVVAAAAPGTGNDDGREPDVARPCLEALHPWRKGPFRIAGVDIDTEWRSDLKWDRVLPHLAPLGGRVVLDVGCGSGYHLWRMREAGASAVLGIEPSLLYAMQFEAVARHDPGAPVACLPLTLEALPRRLGAFDTVFSMGVLYHRRAAAAHLAELRGALRPGGQLVLETLVLDRPAEAPLPDEALDIDACATRRYARMRNVFELPSVARLRRRLEAAGFRSVRAVSLDVTSTDEQRATAWMRFDSLDAALEPPSGARPADSPVRRTVEGLPRPARAVLVADRPEDS